VTYCNVINYKDCVLRLGKETNTLSTKLSFFRPVATNNITGFQEARSIGCRHCCVSGKVEVTAACGISMLNVNTGVGLYASRQRCSAESHILIQWVIRRQ
jgi:hypothetical protein